MQAILTKYLPPTNTKGSRIKASCEARTIFVPWDHSVGEEPNHVAAAEALCVRMAEHNAKTYGTLPRGDRWLGARTYGQLPLRGAIYAHTFLP